MWKPLCLAGMLLAGASAQYTVTGGVPQGPAANTACPSLPRAIQPATPTGPAINQLQYGSINYGVCPNQPTTAQAVAGTTGGWRSGRATFFDAPAYWTDAFSTRGAGSYGDILYTACGLWSTRDGASVNYQDLPFPKENVAAMSVADPDYAGSCGRCYEVRCQDGLVPGNGTTPIPISQFFYQASVNTTIKDDFGRSYPGNSAEAQGLQNVTCYRNPDGSKPSVVVHIIDTCPAYQLKNGTQVSQLWCNSDVAHFDLSYWAMQQLAHPLYGVIPLEFRPVNCYSEQPFSSYLPGYINNTIYGEQVETGWGYYPYFLHFSNFWLPGAGIGGSNATCVNLATSALYDAPGPNVGGGLTFTARNASQPGYQPFGKASSLNFCITSNSTGAGDPSEAVTPKGKVPNVSVGLSNAGGVTATQYCYNNINITTLTPSSTEDGADGSTYYCYSVPLSQFNCPADSLPLAAVDTVSFQSLSTQDFASFCLDNVMLSGGASQPAATSSTTSTPAAASSPASSTTPTNAATAAAVSQASAASSQSGASGPRATANSMSTSAAVAGRRLI